MRIVIALGGNALLKRGDPMTVQVQRRNVGIAAEAIAPLAAGNNIVIVHGNGPQVGLLSLQAESYTGAEPYPLDVLDAGTQGMIGYLIQQELRGLLPPESQVATLLTMVVVDPDDPAFASPVKFVGPLYDKDAADDLAAAKAGRSGRTVTPGGGWCPRPSPGDSGDRADHLAAGTGSRGHLRGRRGHPDRVSLVRSWSPGRRRGGHRQGPGERTAGRGRGRGPVGDGHRRGRRLPRLGNHAAAAPRPGNARGTGRHQFAAGSMGPKVEAAARFAAKTGGRAAIGSLTDIAGIIAGTAGTNVVTHSAPDGSLPGS